MVHRDTIVEAVDIISNQLVEMIVKLAEDGELIKDTVYHECATIHTYLTHYESSILIARICKEFRLSPRNLMDTECDNLPLRYLACYILLNSDNEDKAVDND